MSDEQPLEASSSDSKPTLNELLYLEALKQSENTPAYISLLEQMLQLISCENDPLTWAALQFARGKALQQNQEGDKTDQLKQAIVCYDAALIGYTREHVPANWVALQQYKRSALCDLAELQEGTERVETLKAIAACCDVILTVCTRETTPTNWAVVQYHKAAALYEIAETLHGEECVKTQQEVISCYDAALTVYTRESAPIEWATTQNGKGMSLHKLAQLCGGKGQPTILQEALACYNNALLIYDHKNTKVYRAAVQHNKGLVLHDVAESLEGSSKKALLQSALACFEEALTIYIQEKDILSCAREQSSKGNVLYDLSKIVRGAEHVAILSAALDSYDAALSVYTPKMIPADWAMVQNNKASTFLSLAERLKGTQQKETLQQALTCCEQALTVYTRNEDSLNWGITLRSKGNILRALSELLGDKARKEMLKGSLACFNTVLSEPVNQLGIMNWARTQNDKGLALHVLSRSLGAAESTKALQASLACYDATLSVFIREIAPGSWAEIQNNKSVSLSSLAELLAGEERVETLREAIACCDNAFTAFSVTSTPYSWALTQSNKGNGLRSLAEMLNGAERLDALHVAVNCYDHALAVYTREETPLDWARTQNNKGVTLRNMMGLLAGSERLQTLNASISCFNAALLERRREITPMDWAATQESKGNALSDLAELLGDAEQAQTLQAALACFDAVLEERHREVNPVNWARVQNNKGNVLRSLARARDDTDARQFEMLYEALTCYDAALLEYRHETVSMYWAMTKSNKGVVLNDIARISEEGTKRKELLQEALTCFDAALLEYQREADPATWAMVQVSRGSVLCNLAGLQEGGARPASLREALLCYDAALSVYTREIFPAHHHRIAQSIGMRLFDESEWTQSAKYLAAALDALDDLFTLEVTARGRRATLITSGDLTAHLAYALVRAGGASQGWKAAEALERGRARATGEVIARQEAELTVAEQLAPELFERFREASNRLAAIALKSSVSTTTLETMSITGETAETQVPLELAAMSALNEQLAGYEEARDGRTAYDEVVAIIRQEIPDFLRQEGVLEEVTKELRADERLTYVAITPMGAVSLLISSSDNTHDKPIVEGWWDERLTSTLVTHMLVGAPGEDDDQQDASAGLLTAQAHAGRLRRALRATMQTLGASDGVLTHLATYCRIGSVRRLVFVPCGLLGLLPLHAALVPLSSTSELTEPLIDVVQVSYAPSTRIWAAGRRHGRDSHAEQVEALIVGDPQPQPEGTPPLPGAKDEARVISALMSHAAQGYVSTFTGEAATLSDVLEVLQGRNARLTHVHFACHGLAELANPQASGLLLANGTRLTTQNLLDPAVALFGQLRLVVLSACRTALVGTELPDEVVGLPSAWLQTGAKDVLASFWPVSDSVTVEFMKKFYELHLLDQLDPTEALWLAQRWLRGLQTWRGDCRALGAERAAVGPESSEVVDVLARVRGEMESEDDFDLAGSEEERRLVERETPDEKGIARSGDTKEQHRSWQYPHHWAAFAIYGA